MKHWFDENLGYIVTGASGIVAAVWTYFVGKKQSEAITDSTVAQGANSVVESSGRVVGKWEGLYERLETRVRELEDESRRLREELSKVQKELEEEKNKRQKVERELQIHKNED
jgi:predicted RNase H-like nuclease (RuvC/YqgF family)